MRACRVSRGSGEEVCAGVAGECAGWCRRGRCDGRNQRHQRVEQACRIRQRRMCMSVRTLDGVVAVDDAEAAKEGHVDGHLRLGHGVHRARDQRRVECNPLGGERAQVDVLGVEVDVAWQDDVVLVGVAVAVGEELRQKMRRTSVRL